jgi:hypothetical protein
MKGGMNDIRSEMAPDHLNADTGRDLTSLPTVVCAHRALSRYFQAS